MTAFEFAVPRGYLADWGLVPRLVHRHRLRPAAGHPGDGPGVPGPEPGRARPPTAAGLSAINRIHTNHQLPPPGTDPAVRAWLTTQAGRPAPTDPRPPTELVDQALRRIPIGGWPTGMFGRRDALLILLRHRAGLTHRQLVNLTSDHLSGSTTSAGSTTMSAPAKFSSRPRIPRYARRASGGAGGSCFAWPPATPPPAPSRSLLAAADDNTDSSRLRTAVPPRRTDETGASVPVDRPLGLSSAAAPTDHHPQQHHPHRPAPRRPAHRCTRRSSIQLAAARPSYSLRRRRQRIRRW